MSAGTHRRADIQGLRGISVLLVVAFHAGLPVTGGFVGVDAFFVISGFVITAMLVREVDGTGAISFADFYSRRVRRILPALGVTVAVVAIASLGAVSPAQQGPTARTGVASVFSLANVLLYRSPQGYFDPDQSLNPLLHMWSLSVEEQFYLLFPALVAAGVWWARRRQRAVRPVLITIIAAVTIASLALCVAVTRGMSIGGIELDERFAFYLPFTRAWEFGLGALLALGAGRVARVGRGASTVGGLVGLVLLGYSAFAFDEATQFPGTAALIPVAGTALLIAAGTASGAGPLARLLGSRPLTATGDLSYSWYLWHWPLIVFAEALFPGVDRVAVIAAVVSLLPAWLSYRFVESPIRADQRVRGRRALAVASVCVVVPSLFCALLVAAPTPPASASTESFLSATKRHHADRQRGCNRGQIPSELPDYCTWLVPDAQGEVVLLGDSNAGQFTEAVQRAANDAGRAFSVATFPECPVIGLEVTVSRPSAARCARFARRVVPDLLARRPSVVVLAASTAVYLEGSGARLRDPATGRVANTPDAKQALWAEGLGGVLEQLTDAGIGVVVVHPVPQWVDWDSRQCATARVYLAPRSCGVSQTETAAERFRARAVEAETAALRAVPEAVGLDVFGSLCAGGTCRTNRGDSWIYRDGRHLSVRGALTLTDRLARAVAEAESRVARP